jgi:hypothetical protein
VNSRLRGIEAPIREMQAPPRVSLAPGADRSAGLTTSHRIVNWPEDRVLRIQACSGLQDFPPFTENWTIIVPFAAVPNNKPRPRIFSSFVSRTI